MTRAAQLKAVGVAAVLIAAVWGWQTWRPGDDRAIRRQLDRLADTVNDDPADRSAPIANMARAAQIGGYFTDDVVVNLGQGIAPMQGRETVIAMAARLSSGGNSYTLQFDDVSVNVDSAARVAEVNLAATLTMRNESSGERTVDARELRLTMRETDGAWRIARVDVVDELRRVAWRRPGSPRDNQRR